jgi:hypothetical protein
LATAWEPYQGILTRVHRDFRIGGLKPGETKRIRGTLFENEDYRYAIRIPANDVLEREIALDVPKANHGNR